MVSINDLVLLKRRVNFYCYYLYLL